MGCKDRTGAKWSFVGWRPRNEEQRRIQLVKTEDTREGVRGDCRKKDRRGGEEGISRKGKGKQRGKTSQKVGERSWGKEEREESSEMPQFFGVSPNSSGNTHWVISYLLKSGQVSNALENGEITLLFPDDIPIPVTSGLEHPSTFLLSPPRGQKDTLSGSRQGRTQPVMLGNLQELIPDIVSSFSVIKCGKELLCQHISEKESKQEHILCVARPT